MSRGIRQVEVSKLWFLLGVFILPFVFWPWASIPYEIPKVWFFQRWVEILGILGILRILRKNKSDVEQEGRKEKLLVILPAVFVLIALIASLVGVDVIKSVWGNYFRGDGLLTLFHLAGLFYFLVLFWEESWERLTAKTIFFGSITVSFWTIFLWVLRDLGVVVIVGGSFFGKAVGATFGNPNFLAGYLLVSLPFTIYFLRRWGFGGILGILGQVVAIGFTLSRAAILGVFALGIMLIWEKTGTRGKLGIIIGVFGVLGIFGVRGAGKEFRVSEGMYFFPESRGRIVVRGITAFTKKPLLGWGVANFDYAFESIYWPIKYERDVYVDKAHSNLLEVLVTEGVVGFGIYVGIILLVIKGLLKGVKGEVKRNLDWEKTLLFSFLLFIFHSQTNVISINEEIIFWLIAGIVARKRLLIEAKNGKIFLL